MSTMRKWAELASQNERLALPSDQSSELHRGNRQHCRPAVARAGQERA